MNSTAPRPGETPLFPLYQLMDAFEAFSHGEPDVKAQHRSLYYFLLAYARKRGNVPRFTLPYEVGMHGSSIGSWVTYDAALKALHGWGFVHYTPGANRYKVPVVELTFRSSEQDDLLSYWQAYSLAYPVELQNCNPKPATELQNCNPSTGIELHFLTSTDNPSANSTGDIKKTFRHKTIDHAANAAGLASESEKNESLPSAAQPNQPPADEPSPGESAAPDPAEAAPQAKPKASTRRRTTGPPAPPELLPASCSLAELLNPGGLAEKVQLLREPLTLTQAERLLADYDEAPLRAILCEMANWPKLLTGAASANLTARNWLNRRGIQAGAKQAPAPPPAAAPGRFDPAALFGHDHLTPEQVRARQQSGPEYAAYLARKAQGGATPPTP